MAYATTNPFTGETVKTFSDFTDAEVERAIAGAHATFETWRKTSFAVRAAVMRRAAGLLRRDARALAEILTLEMGKLVGEAEAEVELSAKIFEYYADNAAHFLQPRPLPVRDPAEGEATLIDQPPPSGPV